MGKPESKWRERFNSKMTEKGAWCTPIESGATGDGIPDTFMRFNNRGYWIEYKVIDAPLTSQQKVPFRPGQYNWLRRNHREGGVSLVAIQYNDGYLFASITAVDLEYHIYRGHHAVMTKHGTMITKNDMEIIARWIGALPLRK